MEPDQIVYLQAILQTLQHPVPAGGGPLPPVSTTPPRVYTDVSILLYTSLTTSLLAAFLAMLGKQWINRYIRHQGGSVSERCEDRQRKLDGLEWWKFRIVIEIPPVLLQLSLLLLVVGLSLYLWKLKRIVAWVVIISTIPGAVFYMGIVFAGTLSYACPFQTPLSLILRYLWVNSPAERSEPDPGASCVFWVLDHLTDTGMTAAALRHLVNIGWHHNASKEVPFSQVVRICTKCFYTTNHLISEYRNVAHEAARALVQLYVHRLCSGKNSDHKHQAVINALDHISDAPYDSALQPLATITRSIREPGEGSEHQWEMGEFDIPWVSELWMHHVWLRRTQHREYKIGGIMTEGGILRSIKTLFEKEGTPPPSAVCGILYGLLAGISSSPFPLDNVLSSRR